MLRVKILITTLVLFQFTLSHSQSMADSLLSELKNTSVDSVKIGLMHKLFKEYRYEVPEEAESWINKATALSERTANARLIAISYNLYAGLLESQAKYDSAITVYQKGLEKAEQIDYYYGKSEALVGLGNCFWRKGDFQKAREYQEMNITLSEKADNVEGVASSYNNIGNIYNEQGEYTKAMEYYILSSEKYQEAGNQRNFSITLANIGMIYSKLENFDKSENYLLKSDSVFQILDYQPGRAYVLKTLAIISKKSGDFPQSLSYNLNAIESYEKMGNKHEIGQIYQVIGNTFIEQNKLDEGLEYHKKALDISESISDSVGIAMSFKEIGSDYRKMKKQAVAKRYLLKAIDLANRIDIPLTAMDAVGELSQVYADVGDFDKAYENRIKFGILKDSLYTKEKRELALDIEAKYQNDQKAKENALLTSENKLQVLQIQKNKNQRNTIIIVSLILMILAGLLYYLYRIKKNANSKLRELDRLKSNFFANISHEFRTPLTLIKGPIEYMEQNPDEKLSLDNVKMIRRNSNRLLKLVNQLLDLSKIDEGSLQLDLNEGDVYKCLRAAASSFNSHAAQRNIDYRIKISKAVLWASYDRDKLEKIVYNLLSNAFKFSDEGDLISFDVTYGEQGLLIQIGDSGRGIPEEKQPYIFDRFYQIDSSDTKEKEGTGIGLSLTKDLVALMDGTITVSSEIDKGSYFTVQLPIQAIKTRQIESGAESSKTERMPSKSAPFHFSITDKRNVPAILLVEDNADMRTFIREILIKDYKLKEALNGKKGFEMAISDPPDLVITDLMMPKMDGLELCKKLKTDLNTSHIPVIMLTAKAGMDNKIEGLETGADDYLTKPFDVAELLVRIKNLIDQRKSLRELFAGNDLQIDPKKVTVTSVDQKFLAQVLELLENNFFKSDFGVPQMQEALAMSKAQLHRKIKALTNEAPGELLRNFRLKRAAQLISQKADSVTQIAFNVGFNDASYFAKCFKELYGLVPSAYPTSKE